MTMDDELTMTQFLDEDVETKKEEEISSSELIAERDIVTKRVFWSFVFLSAVIVGLIVWEIVDLVGGGF